MKSYQLSDKEQIILKSVITNEIEDIGSAGEDFFAELVLQEISIKEYIDEHIILAKKFDIDFWNTVKLYTNHYLYNRLMSLYEGKTIREFIETYEIPDYAKSKHLIKAADTYKNKIATNNFNNELEKLKNQIEVIENKIEDNDDFVLDNEFKKLNEIILSQYKEVYEYLHSFFNTEINNEKGEEKIHLQLKELSKLKNRINDIQAQAGNESNEDIRDIMFPDGEDD